MPAKPTRTMSFTKEGIAALKPELRRYCVYDRKVRGLAVDVTPKASRSFYLIRRVGTRSQRIRLGSCAVLSIDAARKQAEKINSDISHGGNPQASKRALNAEATFGEAYATWLELWVKPRLRTSKEVERVYKKHLEPLARRRLSEITTTELSDLHTRIGKDSGPYQANRTIGQISSIYGYARRQSNGYQGRNPADADGVPRFKEHKRTRPLTKPELARFFAALEAEPSADARDCILIAAVTGARRGNCRGMRWADIDLDVGVWTIPPVLSKNKDPMPLILAPPLVTLLRRRREQANGFEYVFPSDKTATGYIGEECRYAFERTLERAGIAGVRFHDLRHTVGTMLATMQVPLLSIGRALGHRSVRSTERYTHPAIDAIRDTMGTAAALMLDGVPTKLLTGEPAQEVTP